MKTDIRKTVKKELTEVLVQDKIQKWCAYQERSQFETFNKLMQYGIEKSEANQIIVKLIESGFLNEERFAENFARGKFRMKKWGRVKIKVELRKQKVNEYCINKALSLINETDYFTTLQSLILQKSKQIKEENKIKAQYKLVQYLISKGYEKEIIFENLNHLTEI